MCSVPAPPSSLSGCYFSYSGKLHFYSSLCIPFSKFCLAFFADEKENLYFNYAYPSLPERSLFLIFFIVSASLPSQLSPAAVGSKPGPKGMAVVQRWGTTLWGGMRRGRESGGQIAISSSFRKLVHQKLPTLGVWITQTPLASATFR